MGTGLRVAVFGATGLAGSEVVRQCLDDPRIGEVRAVTRRPAGVAHAKLREVECADFADLAPVVAELTGLDACFFCLGIAQAQARDEAHYRQVTVAFAVSAARMLREHSPDHTFHYLSGGGADPSGRSRWMWARVKGEAENELSALGLHRLFRYRPGYIHPGRADGPRPSPGIGYTLSRAAYPLLRAALPAVVIAAEELARGMIEATVGEGPGALLGNQEIRHLARRHPAAG